MFSSSNPSPSSIHGLLPPGTFSGQENYGVHFKHHPYVAGEYCCFENAPPHSAVKVSGLQDFDNHNYRELSDAEFSPSKDRVAASNRDQNTKIFTAQGPRNRRVRLSISISRKFFGLQDLLGFNKASETLDWLFIKSKTAIKDLVEEMKHTSSSTLYDQCEEIFTDKGDYLDKKGKKKKKSTQKQKSGFHVNLAARNQLRAEARSRARERTIEKLLVKKLGNDLETNLADHNYCYLESSCGNQIPSQSDHEVSLRESLIEHKLPMTYCLLCNDSQHEYVDDSKDSSSEINNGNQLIYSRI